MKINILGSSSKGNCYIIGNDYNAILLECGLKFDKIQKGVDFNLNKIDLVLVSHEHR